MKYTKKDYRDREEWINFVWKVSELKKNEWYYIK